ncbi:hypothetical protein SELMODRAFT_131708 [Selaginella moellendorffii]|uniref:Protein EARLY FLOWERING 4 domain-containing protein n=1 Tax=Selaginella moellendorffii TaxID=88036 RepID=D8T4R4_SELML|nr:protein ELF4-LIKE 3 [Selaginella moellendorffii]EFJ08467.1 hypothetical protein SELMODRAFT_131708 [Selaginella moellendorffii]|eukprot:XP_002990590.1 protein ELF4-LIKE 3 [Selaginella moellendorffii]
MEADASSAPAKAPPVDRKMWAAFERGFSQVQFLLDHNRLLINEINQNQESKVPESLSRNVVLIKELNKNIGQVVSLYSTISSSFVKSFENSQEGDSIPPPATAKAMDSPAAAAGAVGHKRVRSS